MLLTKKRSKIPQASLGVSEARSKLTKLLRQLDTSPRVFYITRGGKPAGALISPAWLQTLLEQASGKKRFSIFGNDKVAPDWEQALKEFRRTIMQKTIERHERIERENPPKP
jgi:hypothetical protein